MVLALKEREHLTQNTEIKAGSGFFVTLHCTDAYDLKAPGYPKTLVGAEWDFLNHLLSSH